MPKSFGTDSRLTAKRPKLNTYNANNASDGEITAEAFSVWGTEKPQPRLPAYILLRAGCSLPAKIGHLPMNSGQNGAFLL